MIFGILMFAEIWRRPKLLAQSNKYKSPEGFQVAFEKCEKIQIFSVELLQTRPL